MELKCDTPKIIIFCRRFAECSEMYHLFKFFLKERFINPLAAGGHISGRPALFRKRGSPLY